MSFRFDTCSAEEAGAYLQELNVRAELQPDCAQSWKALAQAALLFAQAFPRMYQEALAECISQEVTRQIAERDSPSARH